MHKRKVRTTITQAKLDEMNRIFSLYLEYREVISIVVRGRMVASNKMDKELLLSLRKMSLAA
jgi:transcriptional accessory protein Tex/SPT6